MICDIGLYKKNWQGDRGLSPTSQQHLVKVRVKRLGLGVG